MTDYLASGSDFTAVANAIRTKGGTQAQLSFPTGFVNAIGAISGGGGVSGLSISEGEYIIAGSSLTLTLSTSCAFMLLIVEVYDQNEDTYGTCVILITAWENSIGTVFLRGEPVGALLDRPEGGTGFFPDYSQENKYLTFNLDGFVFLEIPDSADTSLEISDIIGFYYVNLT